MKIKEWIGEKNNPGRIILFVLLGLAILGATSVPLYQAVSNGGADSATQTSSSLNTLPTHLHVNPDGSVRVSFQGNAGALYQIYYSDELASPDKTTWKLVADDVTAGTDAWTTWVDAEAAVRSRPAGTQQGFYRVVLKSAPPAKTTLVMSATASSTDSTATNAAAALKAMRKREIAEIMNLISGGPEMEAALVQKLSETPLTADYILDLLKNLTPEQQWARKAILEAVVLLRPTQLKPKALARARTLLGWVYAAADRHPEAIQQFLEVTRMRPETLQGWEAWVFAGQVYRLQKDVAEARRCWAQVTGRAEAGRWAQEAQWMVGLTYHEERDYAQALEEFKKLAEFPPGDLFRADAYFWMGEALRAMQRWDEAYTANRKVIELNRDLPRSSRCRPQYNRAEKMARAGWVKIAPYLGMESAEAVAETSIPTVEEEP